MIHDIPCKQIEDQLDAFRDGELTPAEAADVRSHLAACPPCSAKVADLDMLVHAVRTMSRAEVPCALAAKLDKIAETGAPQPKVVPLRSRVLIPVAAAAAIVVAVIGGTRLLSPTGTPTVAEQPKQQSSVDVAQQPTQQPTVPTQQVKEAAPLIASEQRPEVTPQTVSTTPSVGEQHAGHAAPAHIAHEAMPVTTTVQELGVIAETPSFTSDTEIAELPSNSNSFAEAVGISTDEDGLYDIRM